MQWTSTLSSAGDLDQAIAEVAEKISGSLAGRPPDLAIAFLSGYASGDTVHLPTQLRRHLAFRNLLGCTAGGVIGGGEEVEQAPALSLTAALLPGVELRGFHLPTEAIPRLSAEPKAWTEAVRAIPEEHPHFLLLADPFSFDTPNFLLGLDRHFPASKKIGGLASGAVQRGFNRLFLNQETYDTGIVGLALAGNLELDTLVAQGCRPIGHPMFVTRCQQNLLRELDGKPPSAVLQTLYHGLAPRDQELFRQSLFLGLVMREAQREYRHGDFLIRNILGLDESREALVVGAALREGQVVQFHLRDAQTSSEDLNAMLIRYKTEQLGHQPPAGALLFSCLGRGAALFGVPNHDSELFRRFAGEVPLGGFFCNGEIGPVQGHSYLHGYTSSFGIFRPK
ncbi:MAG: FIST C-terminal domain-containing protein [bacterium]